ncbi:restriction endonuclease subunit S [Rhodococcus fascians]|uniref:restriction endonuclease subunit S n=1 Tax=Nocardiaceae TaxID=85025 RepID=UPI0019D0C325|nr:MULTISPECIES: restriction endonuclease subunit S [Rhodococcus]MBW4780340.1 restriction endonuclease subunit S [Rhodococcus fascians]MDJ0005009.1 restriction endonuclease subunit S [Rhodococcus fascians]
MSDWRTTTLGEIADVLDSRRRPINSDERRMRLGQVPYYGANGQQGWIDEPLFDEPLILLAEDGGNFDEFATRPIAYRISGQSWVNNHAHIIRAKEGIDQSFLFWSLVHRDIRRFISGGTRTKLTQAEMRSIELAIPSSREQCRIAEILDTLEDQIRATEKIIDKLRVVGSGLAGDLLTSGISADGELRSISTHRHEFIDSPLGRVPASWSVVEVRAMLSVRLGFAFRSDDYQDNGILNFRVSNIGRPLEDLGETRNLPDEFWNRFPKQRLLGGEIVVVMVGATTGSLGRVPAAICPALQNQNMWNLVPQQGIDIDFLWCVLPDVIRRHMDQSQGSARDFLTQKDFLRTMCIRPPLSEQTAITQKISAHQNRLARETAEVAKLRSMKRGLMSDLLNTRVRVAVDTAS